MAFCWSYRRGWPPLRGRVLSCAACLACLTFGVSPDPRCQLCHPAHRWVGRPLSLCMSWCVNSVCHDFVRMCRVCVGLCVVSLDPRVCAIVGRHAALQRPARHVSSPLWADLLWEVSALARGLLCADSWPTATFLRVGSFACTPSTPRPASSGACR